MSHLDPLEQELRELKLLRLADLLQNFLVDAAKQEWDYGTFLGNFVKDELAGRRDRRTEMATRMARLPFVKTLETFDFAPALHQRQADQGALGDALDRQWGESDPSGAARRGQDPPCGRTRDQGGRAGVQDLVHVRAGADRLAGPSQHREST